MGNRGGRYEMIDGKRVLVQEPTQPFVKPAKNEKKPAKSKAAGVTGE